MAYVIGNRIVKETDPTLDNRAYGITLPVKSGNTGYFEQAFTTFDQAKANLRNLLATRRGERIMQPNFGTGLHSLLFEPMTDSVFETKLQDTITNAVSFWLPYITIQQIDVRMTDEMKDRNLAEMSITFSVNNQIQTDSVTFLIQG
jgi:phage baseplate assembly protein W